uniref:Uncharacterized protein n=1 Tax=Anopheles farauti TaxID=69004 RepID=A0A182QI51_9DIPT
MTATTAATTATAARAEEVTTAAAGGSTDACIDAITTTISTVLTTTATTGSTGSTGTNATTVRRQRHSIAGQMSYFKMLGTFSKKMATSTNSLFSTAVISGSSSAPNLRDMIPSTASPSGFGGVPPIRPLETLHNALSLKQLDAFLERMTVAPLFKTPASSPPPKHPLIGAAAPADTTAASAGASKGGAGALPTLSLVGGELPGSLSTSLQPTGTATLDDKCTAQQRAIGGRDFVPVAAPGQQTTIGGAPGTGAATTNANGVACSVAGAQQSWSDHSSSMTSSISALSSGGPSSPNYSEVYSRGCPSSDMSASITSSTDGLVKATLELSIVLGSSRLFNTCPHNYLSSSSSLAAIVGGTEQQLVALPNLFSHTQPQMSPKHPQTEQGAVGVATSTELGPQEDPTNLAGSDGGVDPCLRRSSTLDISGELTPVSACSDWDSNTNEATKGSTTNYDLTTATTNTMEEDDEDATISTDTCLSVGDQQQQQQTTVEATATAGSSSNSVVGKLPLFRGAFPFDEQPHADGPFAGDAAGSKVDNRVRGSRIQRQISLYEKDTRTESKNLHQQGDANEWCAVGFKFEPSGHRSRVDPHQPLPRMHMSFDELHKELPYNERNLLSQQDPSAGVQQLRGGPVRTHQEQADKSFLKSLAQLTIAQKPTVPLDVTGGATGPPSPHTPGALVIREGFIEPPRLTRVTKSFHGKTDHQKLNIDQQQQLEPSRSVGEPCGLRRASDSPIAAPTRYNKNALRSQQQQAGSSRFTTSLVQESPPEQQPGRPESEGGAHADEPPMPTK